MALLGDESRAGTGGRLASDSRAPTEPRPQLEPEYERPGHPGPPPCGRLRAWWEQRATDALWLSALVLLNSAAFGWRFRRFPADAAAGYWPAIAKGSAELALLNTAAAVLTVCHRLLGRLNVSIRRRMQPQAPALLLLLLLPPPPPLDKPLALHKLAGVVVLAASALHSLAWAAILARLRQCSPDEWRASGLRGRLAAVRQAPSAARLALELPVWTGVAMLACLAVAAPFCVPLVRERSFRRFALAHRSLLPFLLLLLFHGAEQWTGTLQTPLWLAPPLLAYCVERMRRLPLLLPPSPPSWRALQRRTEAAVERAARHADVLALQLRTSEVIRRRLEPGAYVFVAAPALSRWEWHPFSVASAPEDAAMRLHVRVAGDWTAALAQALLGSDADADLANEADDRWSSLDRDRSHDRELIVHLDGPVASPTVLFGAYTHLALLSTGVGVTPHLSVLRHLLHAHRRGSRPPAPRSEPPVRGRVALRMVWSTRQIEYVHWLLDALDEFADELAAAAPDAFEVSLHVTGLSTGLRPPATAIEERQDSRRRRAIDRLTAAARRFPCLRVEFARAPWAAAIDRILESMSASAADATTPSPPPLGVFICSGTALARHLKRRVAAAVAARRQASGQERRVDVFAEGF